jgi:hypothetical protein
MVCAILTKIYVESRGCFEREAAEMGCTLEQLAAAAVTQIVRERVEQRQAVGNEAPRDGRSPKGRAILDFPGMLNAVQGFKPGEKHRLATTVLVLLSAFEGGRLRADGLRELLAALDEG